MKLLNRRRERAVANAMIADPENHTTMDPGGAVRSIQAANVDMPVDQLVELWQAQSLERLARTYWWYLSRVTLGLVRVHYRDDERAVVLVTRPFVLLRFHPPDYELEGDRGIVRWRIRDGLLVSRKDDGYLEIDVRRGTSEHVGYGRAHVEVEVANFYPALARPFKWFYVNTQSRVHVVVTHGFLKRLARLELEESSVGRFADQDRSGRVPEDRNVGSTPWTVVGALVASVVLIYGILVWAFRR
ncbi:MAG: hypothetical protein WKF94_10045 [Solirubrobacteraceae bacterium]